MNSSAWKNVRVVQWPRPVHGQVASGGEHGIALAQRHAQPVGGAQVLADLVIALVLVMVWIWKDARATGRNVWPWLAATAAPGSCGPLLCLLTRKAKTGSASSVVGR